MSFMINRIVFYKWKIHGHRLTETAKSKKNKKTLDEMEKKAAV